MGLSLNFPVTMRCMHVVVRTIACGILVLSLTACGIPQRRTAEPGPPLPDSFNGVTSTENSSQLGIVEFYQDPQLQSLIQYALENNRELKILNEEVQISSNEILSRSGAYLPFMTAGPMTGLFRASNRTIEGAAIRDDEFLPGKYFSNPYGNYLLGTSLVWKLDIYRQLRNARDAAAQRYVAAIERRNYFVTEMVADIADNYFRLMALDKRIENLDQIIAFMEQSLTVARARKEAARDTELAVLRFEAEVRRNQSEKLIVYQDIVEAENAINKLSYRYPTPIPRNAAGYFDLYINALEVGVPTELLQNRPDIRRAERELVAAGLSVEVARANYYPQLVLDAGVGLNAFAMSYLFMPQAVVGNIAAGFIGPLVNRRAIRAEYLANDAKQMQAVYDYQRTILEAFTDVVNRLTEVQNYSKSVALKKQQMLKLENAVEVANQLFQFARTEYLDVLTAQRDLRDSRTALIDAKEKQLSAIVNAYQSLGGGTVWSMSDRENALIPIPITHDQLNDEDFRKLSKFHYAKGHYFRALRNSLDGILPYPDNLNPPDPLKVPDFDMTAPEQLEDTFQPTQLYGEGMMMNMMPAVPDNSFAMPPRPPTPPPAGDPGPFSAKEEKKPVTPKETKIPEPIKEP
jgi:NodT family efflux transporter outer membrane factor (OMF) lipoprotein